MKKKTLADGTVEIEGDLEEILEYEKKHSDDVRRDESKKKGKGLLNEQCVAELIQDALDRHEAKWPHQQQYCPIWIYNPPYAWDKKLYDDDPYNLMER